MCGKGTFLNSYLIFANGIQFIMTMKMQIFNPNLILFIN